MIAAHSMAWSLFKYSVFLRSTSNRVSYGQAGAGILTVSLFSSIAISQRALFLAAIDLHLKATFM